MKHIQRIAFIMAGIMLLNGCSARSSVMPETVSQASEVAATANDSQPLGIDRIALGGRDAYGENGMVATGREEATQIGLDILRSGGNVVDAAVAIGFALGVCEQQSSGIGGGGFMTLHLADSGETVFVDFRDQAASSAGIDQWTILADGTVQNSENKIGGKAIAVPGEVKGLLYALEAYGTMSRQAVMQPAINLATNGFTVSDITSRNISDAYGSLSKYPSTAQIYLNEDGLPYQTGDVIRNPDLAKTLQLIAAQGENVFYYGEIAEKIVAAVQNEGGNLTMEDMAGYEIHVSEPVHGTYRGYDIYSANLPSSGGTAIVEILNILENFDVGSIEPNSAEYFHLMSEAMKLGFADRTAYMGDPAFENVPAAGLISKEYAKEQAAQIDMNHGQNYNASDPWPYESESTTSYSVMDRAGNMVCVTKTVDSTFASALVAEGTGILMNNTLVDFSLDSDSPNFVQGGKRPLSSMSPTLVLKNGEAVIALGAPGETRIITGVIQIISKVIDHGMDVQDAIDAPRMHDSFGKMILEKRVDDEVIQQLIEMGHEVDTNEIWLTYPCVQACMRLPDGTLRGAADPRRDGIAMGY